MTDQAPLSVERIKEIRAGCEGVTPGPWKVATDLPSIAIMALNPDGTGGRRVVQTPNQNNYRRSGPSEPWLGIESFSDAGHIANCDPQTIAQLCDLALRSLSPVGDGVELPEAIRVPLHELHADAGYLAGRVAADGASAGMVAETIRDHCDAIESAVRAALAATQARPAQEPGAQGHEAVKRQVFVYEHGAPSVGGGYPTTITNEPPLNEWVRLKSFTPASTHPAPDSELTRALRSIHERLCEARNEPSNKAWLSYEWCVDEARRALAGKGAGK